MKCTKICEKVVWGSEKVGFEMNVSPELILLANSVLVI